MEALSEAVRDWKRVGAALSVVVGGFGLATVVATPTAMYGAWLLAFSVWMALFVVTAVEVIGKSDF